MTMLLIPDAGPLFSLAAADLLNVLTHFRLGLTDVVKQEMIDRGKSPLASLEAQRLLGFYKANKAKVEIFKTQVGHDLRQMRKKYPGRKAPANMGEFSIQSFLIHLQIQDAIEPPVIIFEDAWFLRHAAALAKLCIVLSTQAFLVNAERLGLITSAAQARQAIGARRPMAWSQDFRR